MKKRSKVSKALREVWAWKDACYREVAHLPLEQRLRKRLEIAERTANELGIPVVHPAKPVMVAEAKAKYKAKRKK